MTYADFIDGKSQHGLNHGFAPIWVPDWLYDFQKSLVEWATVKGRAAIFADCGLGKTPIQLVWAHNVWRKTSRPVLILTPLAVSHQTVREADKFGIEAVRSSDGRFAGTAHIVVTNYERLQHFRPEDFSGCVCDESSILKNFDGSTKAAITEFMRNLPYRLLCTATAAPNDYIELGTSSECIGELGFSDMLNRFFKKVGSTTSRSDELRSGVWRFRGHAERDFWRWVCSWARAVRKPSDLGFSDDRFKLPEFTTSQHVVSAEKKADGFLFDLPAVTLQEQRDERRRTLTPRCDLAAELAHKRPGPSVCWCHLNDEGDALESALPGAVQVSGDDPDERKEEVFAAFEEGEITKLVTKPTIAGFGLNWQHCAHMTFFPSHSFEQWYQSVRRCWRFGQQNPVHADIVTSECESRVMANLQRKADAADAMFERLVNVMNNELRITKVNLYTNKEKAPSWL